MLSVKQVSFILVGKYIFLESLPLFYFPSIVDTQRSTISVRFTVQSMEILHIFYTGDGDKCKCFYCGSILYDWDPEDDPLLEHAKWFPDCAWIKLVRKVFLFILPCKSEKTITLNHQICLFSPLLDLL